METVAVAIEQQKAVLKSMITMRESIGLIKCVITKKQISKI